jgi:indole-3-glycerol phosphate synthase
MSRALRHDFLATKAADVRRTRGTRDGTGDDVLRGRCLDAPPAPSLAAALRGGDRVAVMAEYKRQSPSAGPLAPDEDPVNVAVGYIAAGAAALSVLTDRVHFAGDLTDLQAVAAVDPDLPVLRKDFIVDVGQLLEARLAGAAAVLLIAAILDDGELAGLLAAADELGLESLVEVHTEAELERAGAAGATLIGINNRDLRRLTTDLLVTERLARRAPAGAVVVSESGIRTAGDVRRVRDAGAHAVLVGEALLRVAAPQRDITLRQLAGVAR